MLFDLHCDTVGECFRGGWSLDVNPLHWDLTRASRYAPCCQVFAVWIPDALRGYAAYDYTIDVLHFVRAQAAALSDRLQIVVDEDGLRQARKNGRIAALWGIESGAALDGDVARVETFAAIGVRVMTLTWNGENELGYGCECPHDKGLKPFGRQVFGELRRCGIIPDVSHLNEAGFWDAVAIDDRPLIASHSLSRQVWNHPRNLTDDQFVEMVRRGGLVGLNFCKSHLGEQSFDAVRRHAEHFLSLGGEKIVALGGDLDGTKLPPAWDGVAVYESLAEYLYKKGFGEDLIHRIFYQNAADFFASTLQMQENAVQ